ncbi:MAG: hypothetical protein ACREOP_08355 [Thermodesulfobacteriota bacterium]
MSITPEILKQHFETDLVDEAIQRLIDSEDAEITRRFGSNASVTEQHLLAAPMGYNGQEAQKVSQRRIWTKQPIGSVTSVKEGPTLAAADLTTLVVDTDYRVINNGRAIERIDVDFDRRVEIVYVPVSDVKRRDRVTIDLVKLSIQYQGLSSEKVGDYANTSVEYQKEREAILRSLNSGIRSYA